jgi:hypothetical protein
MTFKKGRSGNPRGRAVEIETAEVRLLARQYTPEAVARLVHWMRSDNPKASVAATSALLDRGWGKPNVYVALEGRVEVSASKAAHDELIQLMRQGAVTIDAEGRAMVEGPTPEVLAALEARRAIADGRVNRGVAVEVVESDED